MRYIVQSRHFVLSTFDTGPRKHEAFTQCRVNAVPTSTMAGYH